MIKALPIRFRLTFWYFAMFATAAGLLCFASAWMLRRSIDVTEYHELQERAEDVQLVLRHMGQGRSSADIQRELAELYDLKDDGKYLEVRDAEGNWLYRSRRITGENLDVPAPAALPAAGITQDLPIGKHQVRVLLYRITAYGREYTVQSGLMRERTLALMSDFSLKMLLLGPAVILLAALGGHIMSRKALRPVADLAGEARRITDRNLDVRLPVPAARDEIADLSRTLNQMLERISRAFASIRTFTGNASHELRTPLSLLRAEIEVALMQPRSGEEYRQVLQRLQSETLRMTALVENLLSLARADGGAETPELRPVSMAALLGEAQAAWMPAMERAMLDFAVEAPAPDLTALADRASLLRLLSILIENAAKFTPPGGRVQLTATAVDGRVRVSVRDTGVGIAPEHLPHIFTRFYRAAPTGPHAQSGSGLGLAIARWIAERHGTRLEVASTPEVGSEFWLLLSPAGPAAQPQTSPLRRETPLRTGSTH